MGFPNVRIVKIFTFGENVMEQYVKEVFYQNLQFSRMNGSKINVFFRCSSS